MLLSYFDQFVSAGVWTFVQGLNDFLSFCHLQTENQTEFDRFVLIMFPLQLFSLHIL